MSDSLYFPTHIGLLTPEHVEKIGPALWEFLWLIARTTKEIKENGETIGIVLGGRPIKILEIADSLGNTEITTKRNLARLDKHGYIIKKRTPYGNIYKVRNSKKFYKNRSVKKDISQKGDRSILSRDRSNMTPREIKNDPSNKIKKDKEKINNIYVEIIDYLNQKTGRKFSPKSSANQKHINGRLSEGRTVDDLLKVIDIKTEQWLGNEKMEMYLRPSTLFSPKNFENYLNEIPVQKAENQSDPRDKEIELQQWIVDGNDPNDFNWNN